ncbi:helix-turn-helix transcriptional regulator [Rossellomorea aquimaris]|uniref:Helix-turn-helix transcriptional regulator n=1 Tax=Rossellomorea aquimaris TaxID=189382 RepID=A0A5D4UGY0_9BACI|nr:helix-turn-helix transcriptional regulator [Rossellomorea aquimaris]TYS77613.1 helix-turn-helix transcriptional regulator [Rossellomorea aquimaris]TYS86795.1 helix-turn-helix transcriptional regulator [Rossellomorea aquimaris]TYS87598.1 helix-turn-helix transcriptional regulator [Rossellomorea aquimaris]
MKRRKLIELRKQRNLTQRQVAESLGISEVYVRKIEKGDSDPGRETMVKFQQFYRYELTELFPDIFLINFDTKCINQ